MEQPKQLILFTAKATLRSPLLFYHICIQVFYHIRIQTINLTCRQVRTPTKIQAGVMVFELVFVGSELLLNARLRRRAYLQRNYADHRSVPLYSLRHSEIN